MIDLTDKSFGRLVVIDLLRLDRNGHYIWSCLCECGNQTRSSTHDLLSGHTKSCGCLRKELLIARSHRRSVPVEIGARFSNLVVLEECGRNYRKRLIVRVACDCGRNSIVEFGNLLQGVTKSCGCKKYRLGSLRNGERL